jgi:hypothetical protein
MLAVSRLDVAWKCGYLGVESSQSAGVGEDVGNPALRPASTVNDTTHDNERRETHKARRSPEVAIRQLHPEHYGFQRVYRRY